MTLQMDIYKLIDKYDAPAPRYTSYPTANHFHEQVDGAAYEGWLANIQEDEPLSLYLHIPFCAKMCSYCGCHTKILPSYKPAADYVDHLLTEIDLVAARLARKQKSIQIQWGGGTPTYLSADDIERVFEKLRTHFDLQQDAELGMEIDPRTITQDKIKRLSALGVNRISFGVQDFDEKVQQAINRDQPYEQVKQVTQWARDAGINDINFDLMYGLPLQSRETIERTMEQAASLDPKRLAVFGYAHVPWFAKHQTKLEAFKMPDAHERYDQFMILSDALARHGYLPVGIDHFAKEDDALFTALKNGALHRNFQGYTTDTAQTMISFGATAISQTPGGFAQNTPLLKKYREAIENGKLPTARGLQIDNKDALRRAIIEKMMCYFETDYAALTESEQTDVADKLAAFEADGMIERTGTKVKIKDEAKIFTRLICTAFDAWFAPAENRHARAV